MGDHKINLWDYWQDACRSGYAQGELAAKAKLVAWLRLAANSKRSGASLADELIEQDPLLALFVTSQKPTKRRR